MKPISRTRIVIIALVTLVSIWQTWPTARYYLALREKPEVESARPFPSTPEPPEDQIEERARWEAENPEVVAWEAAHPEYVAWEKRTRELQKNAIPLGLDLLGGADVTLVIDRQKAIQTELTSLMSRLQADFEGQKMAPRFELAADGNSFTITLENPQADARKAANILAEYEEVIQGDVSQAALETGTVRIAYQPAEIQRRLTEAIEGARKGVAERIDALGVTQPRISLQGQDRIRIQVPGEGNPDRLISSVIQPAFLEFRMVHAIHKEYRERGESIWDANGKIRPEIPIPAGAEVVEGKLGQLNEETRQVDYTYQQFIVMREAPLTGNDLRNAAVSFNPTDLRNPIQVALEFKPEGAREFHALTREYAGKGRQLAILLDGVVRSAPELQTEIADGRAVITGGFTNEEASDLSQILKAGSLPAPLQVESKRTVGATLGVDSIMSGVRALVVGTIVVAAFMILYYGTAGAIAVLALILNVLIILAIMELSRATLTMSGIGGILLTVGMAVDANVLIYERMREEVAAGRPLRQAISTGFNRAFTVILDSNLTTLLSALVLLQFTEGSVFGFALTMTFGLLANLFTGLTVTYTLCALWFMWRGSLSLGKLDLLRDPKIKFLSLRKFTLPLSMLFFFGGLIVIWATGGLNFGVDFEGGVHMEVQFAESAEIGEDEIRGALPALEQVIVQEVVDQPNMFLIDAKLVEAGPGENALVATENLMRAGLGEAFGDQFEVVATAQFGSETGLQFSKMALWVTLLSSIAILIYLSLRFEPAFGVAAVLALVHDMIIVIVLAHLWNVTVTLEVVAALMVLLGFSVNDTIVVFDRIRENTRALPGRSFAEICDLSMNQTLMRTIITSGTTLIAVTALLVLGGESIRDFSKVLFLGVLTGTYSSCLLAAPLVYMWNQHRDNRLQIALAQRKLKKPEAARPVGRTVARRQEG